MTRARPTQARPPQAPPPQADTTQSLTQKPPSPPALGKFAIFPRLQNHRKPNFETNRGEESACSSAANRRPRTFGSGSQARPPQTDTTQANPNRVVPSRARCGRAAP